LAQTPERNTRNFKGDTVKPLNKVVCLAALAISASGVRADILKETVHFSDLDLSRGEGAATLYGRINSAARLVCAPLDAGRLSGSSRFRACVKTAIQRAVSDVHQPLLTQYCEAALGTCEQGNVGVEARQDASLRAAGAHAATVGSAN
jgi:UrcA family protein